jgi:hypothetical protein
VYNLVTVAATHATKKEFGIRVPRLTGFRRGASQLVNLPSAGPDLSQTEPTRRPFELKARESSTSMSGTRWGDDSSSDEEEEDVASPASSAAAASPAATSPPRGRREGRPSSLQQAAAPARNVWQDRSGRGGGGGGSSSGSAGRGGGAATIHDHCQSRAQPTYQQQRSGGDRDARGGSKVGDGKGNLGGKGPSNSHRARRGAGDEGTPDWKAAARSASILSQDAPSHPSASDGVSWMEQRRLKQQEAEREREKERLRRKDEEEQLRASKRKSQLAALKEAVQAIKNEKDATPPVSSLQAALDQSFTPPPSPKHHQPPKKILARPQPPREPATDSKERESAKADSAGGPHEPKQAQPQPQPRSRNARAHADPKSDGHVIETASGNRVEYRIDLPLALSKSGTAAGAAVAATADSAPPSAASRRVVEHLPNGAVRLSHAASGNSEGRESSRRSNPSEPARGTGGRGGRGRGRDDQQWTRSSLASASRGRWGLASRPHNQQEHPSGERQLQHRQPRDDEASDAGTATTSGSKSSAQRQIQRSGGGGGRGRGKVDGRGMQSEKPNPHGHGPKDKDRSGDSRGGGRGRKSRGRSGRVGGVRHPEADGGRGRHQDSSVPASTTKPKPHATHIEIGPGSNSSAAGEK